MAKRVFTIGVQWTEFGEYKVEAESLEEAKRLVMEANAPYDDLPAGEYLDDSLIISDEYTRDRNHE